MCGTVKWGYSSEYTSLAGEKRKYNINKTIKSNYNEMKQAWSKRCLVQMRKKTKQNKERVTSASQWHMCSFVSCRTHCLTFIRFTK